MKCKNNQPASSCLIFKYSENTQNGVEENLVNIRKCKRALGLMKEVEKYLRAMYVLLLI